MGLVAMRELGVECVKDHGVFALIEIGVGHPKTCMADGVMSATRCTYGKLMMERLGYGKMAMVLHAPGKGAVRVYLRSEFQDELAASYQAKRKTMPRPGFEPGSPTRKAGILSASLVLTGLYAARSILPGPMAPRPNDN